MRITPRLLVPLLALVLLVYWPVAGYDYFLLDDPGYVMENVHVQHGLNLQDLSWAFTSFHMGYWIPLTWVSYMADAEIFGFGPRGFHITNVVLHLAATALLFLALRAATGDALRAAFATALFALHPLRVESVAWITERKDVLSGVFGMAALGAYVRHARRPRTARLLLVALLLVAGLMAKAMLVTLPFVLLLLDYWPLGRLRPGAAARRRVLLEKLPLFAIALAFGILTVVSQGQAGAIKGLGGYSLAVRLANALVSYVKYLRKTLWPHDLAAFYVHPGAGIPLWQAALAAVLLAAVTILALREARRLPHLGVGWAWFVLTILPVIGLTQSGYQGMADRFSYLPSVGLSLVAAWTLPALLPGPRRRGAALALAGAAVAVGLAAASRVQVTHWRGTIPLLERALALGQDHDTVRLNLGEALRREGRLQEARAQFEAGLALNPSAADLHVNLGVVLRSLGRAAEAAGHYRTAIALDSGNAAALLNLGELLYQTGRLAEARACYERGLAADPSSPRLHNNLGVLLESEEDLAAAERHYLEAVRLDPRHADALVNLGVVHARQGRAVQAEAALRRALEVAPGSADAHNNLGLVLMDGGRHGEAGEHFAEALRLRPDFPEARQNLEAWRRGR